MSSRLSRDEVLSSNKMKVDEFILKMCICFSSKYIYLLSQHARKDFFKC